MASFSSSRQDLRILLFTRYPQPGTTKTRLAKILGAKAAAQMQREMTEKLLARLKPYAEASAIGLDIYFSGGSVVEMAHWLGPHSFIEQQGIDLGEKMLCAFGQAFTDGALEAVIIGSDIPALDDKILRQAFSLLQENRLALGPSTDGGYYLIGYRRQWGMQTLQRLLVEMPWSTDGVAAETLKRVREAGLDYGLLPLLDDIDTVEDYRKAKKRGLLP